jgi:tyrosyl-tRNA synthetase
MNVSITVEMIPFAGERCMGEVKTAIGLMSGTSMDGIDIALLHTDGETIVKHGPSGYFPYDPQLRAVWQKALVTAKSITQRTERPGDLTQAERKLTLTSPLLTTSSGAKMGKSLNGAVWLNPDMLSAYDFWQYWRNTEDADVSRFLKLYTTLPMDEIARLSALGGSEINEVKKILATEITAMLHGRQNAEQAAETARKTFEEGALADDLPSIDVPKGELEAGLGLLSLIVRAGLATSNGEARRHIQGGAVRINDQSITDERQVIGAGEVTADGVIKLSLGKKKHILVRPA